MKMSKTELNRLIEEIVNKKLKEFIGPMGGDQRNMRGSTKYEEPDTDVWNGRFVEVDLLDWENNNKIISTAKQHNVILEPSHIENKTARIYGKKQNVKNFLMSQGWNSSDLKKWYNL